jgi:hypothetical protein
MERNPSPPWFLGTVLVAFVAFSGWVVATDPWGIPALLRAPWGAQVGLDLCIALSLVWTLLARDPRYRGERLWPWMLATLPLGSIAPLAFLLSRRLRAGEPAARRERAEDHAR